MKTSKGIGLFIIIWVVILVFAGCEFIDYTYSLEHSTDSIKKVEIHSFDYDSMSTSKIIELSPDTWKSLLTDITSLVCHQHFGDHTQDYGPVVVYITYTNGEAEVIGMCNSAWIDSNGKWWLTAFYFDDMEWCSVILKYVDPEIIPELVEYVEEYHRIFG